MALSEQEILDGLAELISTEMEIPTEEITAGKSLAGLPEGPGDGPSRQRDRFNHVNILVTRQRNLGPLQQATGVKEFIATWDEDNIPFVKHNVVLSGAMDFSNVFRPFPVMRRSGSNNAAGTGR